MRSIWRGEMMQWYGDYIYELARCSSEIYAAGNYKIA